MADLSKLKLGNTVYNLKDAKNRTDLAQLISDLKDAAYKDVISAVADINTANLPTGAVVKSYVDSQIGTINKFDVKIVDKLPTPSATTMYILYLVADRDAEAGAYIEYITIRSGSEGAYTYTFEQIGSTKTDLSDYLTIVRGQAFSVADVDFGNDDAISAQELINALKLGDLAFANTATGNTTLETINTITMAPMTIAGNATVGHTSTEMTSTGDYTPEGSVTGTVSGLVSAAALAADNVNGVAVSGTVSTPTLSVTTANTSVYQITGVGTLPTKAADTFKAATWEPTNGNFNTDAMKMHIATGSEIAGDVDAETLVIENAATGTAVASAEFSGGSFTEGAFTQGTLPTRGEVSVATGIQSATASQPSFTGDKFAISLTKDGTKDISATFAGTAAKLSVSGNYDKANAAAAFSVTQTPAVAANGYNRTAKTIEITVNPDA